MNRFFLITTLALVTLSIALMAMTKIAMNGASEKHKPMNLYQFSIQTLEGEDFDLSSLKGKKVMLVNTASKCGLTPQYAQLQELYEIHGNDQFEIIGFPCNDFAAQEPGSPEEISSFCEKNYGVSFPMMQKVHVKGENQHPIYTWLTNKAKNGVSDYKVRWNFHKFLIDENGNLVKEVRPRISPIDEEVLSWIKK